MRRPSLITRFIVVALLVVLTGCSVPPALTDVPPTNAGPLAPNGLSLTANQTSYARGATARLTLRNAAQMTATTGVLECAQLEGWTGGAWVTSPVGNDRACIQIARVLRPGETMAGGVKLDVPAGTYRLMQSVSLEGAEVAEIVTTAAFRVQ